VPELPEVETIRRSLVPVLVGKRITSLWLSPLAPLDHTTPEQFRRSAKGKRILSLGRRGKYLLVNLEGDQTLILHLGMSGNLIYSQSRDLALESSPHLHLRLNLSPSSYLYGIDPRRFGRYSLGRTSKLSEHPLISHLGYEFDDPALTPQVLAGLARRHRRLEVKNFLLNQRIIAGIGNIYACEILFHARIHPQRRMGDLSLRRLERLLSAMREVLSLAISQCGTSLRDYRDGFGNPGNFASFLKVYGREGEPNPHGPGRVRRIVQQGRSTFFVPGWQR